MMKKLFATMAMVTAVLCACQNVLETEEKANTPESGNALAEASLIHCSTPAMEDLAPAQMQTRTAFGTEDTGTYPVEWRSGDAVKLYTSDGSENADYTTSSNGADVDFTSLTGVSGSGRLAVYPASKAGGISAGQVLVDLSGLASQSAQDVLADITGNVQYFPMWAKEGATPGEFSFKNIVGCIALQINDYQGLELAIKKVTITSASKDILGVASVNPSTGAVTLPDKTDKNSITIVYDTAKDVQTKYIENSVECFTIGIPAGTYPANDLTFELTDDDGRVFTQTVSKALTINAGRVKKMAKLQITLRYGDENCFIFAPGETKVIDVTPKYTFSSRFDKTTLQPVKNTSGGTFSVSLTKDVLWEQLPTTDSGAGTVITASSIDGYNLSVTAGSDEGNALIAIKDGETIVWSFHIWVTDTPADHLYKISDDTFQMMDRNLGAVQATAANDEESVLAFGLFYQWGRKDPIPSYSTAKNNRTFTHTSRVERVKGTHTVAYSVHNPTTIITYTSAAPWLGFVSDKAANAPLWGAPIGTINTLTIKTVTKSASAYVKTVFDPCPVGYQVPQAYRFSGISNSVIPSPSNNGHALLYDGANTAYYPFSGAISSTATSATPTQVGSRNHIITATPYGTGGTQSLELQMVSSPSQVSGTSYCPQTMSGSVRCVKTSSL